MVVRKSENACANGHSERADRFDLTLAVQGQTGTEQNAVILIHNLSVSGALIETDVPLAMDAEVVITIPEAGKVKAIVVWQSGNLVGCRFENFIPHSAVSSSRLRNPLPPEFNPLMKEAAVRAAPSLGATLRQLRQERRLSLQTLAKLSGLSKPSIWAWESDKVVPRMKNLEILAAIFSVPTIEITKASQSFNDDLQAQEIEKTSIRSSIDTFKHKMLNMHDIPVENIEVIIKF